MVNTPADARVISPISVAGTDRQSRAIPFLPHLPVDVADTNKAVYQGRIVVCASAAALVLYRSDQGG